MTSSNLLRKCSVMSQLTYCSVPQCDECENDEISDEVNNSDDDKSKCDTPPEYLNEVKREKAIPLDKRLQYWQRFLRDREKLKGKIIAHTKKEECELLMNRNYNFQQVQAVKTTLDYAQRLNPEVLIETKPPEIKHRYAPCEKIYGKRTKTEDTECYNLGITDLPILSKYEQNIKVCNHKVDLLNSKHLATAVCNRVNDIKRVIDHYPDFSYLHVVGEPKPLSERVPKLHICAVPEKPKLPAPKVDRTYQVKILDADSFRGVIRKPEYFILVNDMCFDDTKERTETLIINISVIGKQFEKVKITMIHIKNYGTKTVDFRWHEQYQVLGKISSVFNNFEKLQPAFYFNKNPFRLCSGQSIVIPVIFRCREFGVYKERWHLESDPNFFEKPHKIIVNLYGVSDLSDYYRSEINAIGSDLNTREIRQLTKDLIKKSTMLINPAEPFAPHNISDNRVFSIKNPTYNPHLGHLDELKKLDEEIREKFFPQISKKWNLDLDQLKDRINQIEDNHERNKYYDKLVKILQKFRHVPKPDSDYLDSSDNDVIKFYVVRNIIGKTLETIDDLAEKLRTSLMETTLKLEFNEVCLPRTKPDQSFIENALADPPAEPVMTENESDNELQEVVKANEIRQKMQTVYEDALLIEFSNHFKVMAEDIAGAIEEINRSRKYTDCRKIEPEKECESGYKP